MIQRIRDMNHADYEFATHQLACQYEEAYRQAKPKGDWVAERLVEVILDKAVASWRAKDGGMELMTIGDLIWAAARDCARSEMGEREGQQ